MGCSRLCALLAIGERSRGELTLFVKEDGSWHLADAYDLLSVKMLMPDDTENMVLTLNGKKARIDGGDFRTFAKTIGLNERQAAKAVSRVADALASSLDAGFGDSLVTDEFASGFARLVHANLDRIV